MWLIPWGPVGLKDVKKAGDIVDLLIHRETDRWQRLGLRRAGMWESKANGLGLRRERVAQGCDVLVVNFMR